MLTNTRRLSSRPGNAEQSARQLGQGSRGAHTRVKKPGAVGVAHVEGTHVLPAPRGVRSQLEERTTPQRSFVPTPVEGALVFRSLPTSHEVTLSDVSDSDGPSTNAGEGCGRSCEQEQQQPRQHHMHPKQQQQQQQGRRRQQQPPGPAAALASVAVASARRRTARSAAPTAVVIRRPATSSAGAAAAAATTAASADAATAAADHDAHMSSRGAAHEARSLGMVRGRSAGDLAALEAQRQRPAPAPAATLAVLAVLLTAIAAAAAARGLAGLTGAYLGGRTHHSLLATPSAEGAWAHIGARSGGWRQARGGATSAFTGATAASATGDGVARRWFGRWAVSPSLGGGAGRGGSHRGGSGGALVGRSTSPSRTAVAATAGGGGGGAASAAGGGGGAWGAAAPGGEPHADPLHESEQEWRESATVRVVTVTSGAPSPYRTSWAELAAHSAQRLEWTDPAFQMLVFSQNSLAGDAGVQEAFLRALSGGAHMLVGLDVAQPAAEAFLRDPRVAARLPPTVLFVGGSQPLAADLTRLQGGLRPQDPGSWRTALARRLPWTPDGSGLAVWDTLQQLLARHDSDNFLFVFLVLINQYVTTVRQVADTTKGLDLQSLLCMVKNCGAKVVGCVRDPTCKAALDCLNACAFNDQVCQYRCIVSHESPLLGAFSLCVLQLHNCRALHAQPPLLPDPAPMPSFRGAPLTHATAEQLLLGWLDAPGQGAGAARGGAPGERPGRRFSWLVAAGKNPAYDFFPCQHQLFYRGKGPGQVWYEPVFKAITLDGREVWRRRVYRVRRGKVPGTFHLSVLDNGVTSNEFWRLLDCEDHLAFCLFYYSGAASAAGLSYSGAVLATPDGRMPGPQHTARLEAALGRAGIRPWELSFVDNSDCGEAPLDITGPVGQAA